MEEIHWNVDSVSTFCSTSFNYSYLLDFSVSSVWVSGDSHRFSYIKKSTTINFTGKRAFSLKIAIIELFWLVSINCLILLIY